MTVITNNNQRYFEKQFDSLQLIETCFDELVFDRCLFLKCDFSHTKFKRCKFIDCEFSYCNLSLLSVENSTFSEVVFQESKMIGINWALAKWPQIKLMSPIHFYQCDISHSSFFNLSLAEINIENCKAHEVDFREADLSNANVVYTDFYKSFFVHTKLIHVDFTEATHYNIDINLNDIRKSKFSFPEVISLLQCLDITIAGIDKS